jgi:predicted amidohydrolase
MGDRYPVVMGVCEKIPRTIGTLFNSQVFIGPDGALIGKHQKIMPTVGERLVHMGGFGDTFGAAAAEASTKRGRTAKTSSRLRAHRARVRRKPRGRT